MTVCFTSAFFILHKSSTRGTVLPIPGEGRGWGAIPFKTILIGTKGGLHEAEPLGQREAQWKKPLPKCPCFLHALDVGTPPRVPSLSWGVTPTQRPWLQTAESWRHLVVSSGNLGSRLLDTPTPPPLLPRLCHQLGLVSARGPAWGWEA